MSVLETPRGLKYTLSNIIGRGSYGKVYAAFTDNDNDDPVAIKMIEIVDDFSLGECKMEFKNLVKCHNLPYVTSFHEIFIEEKNFYVIMPLYKPIPRNADGIMVAKWFYQLLVGLNEIHTRGLVHGDIKGDNLLLTADNEIRICDFGISLKIGSTERDICAHIYKTKKRLEGTLEAINISKKKKKTNNSIANNNIKYPRALPYDDLVAAGHTIINMFNIDKLCSVKLCRSDRTEDLIPVVLDYLKDINIPEKLNQIIDKKFGDDPRLNEFFKFFLGEIFNEKKMPAVSELIKNMETFYGDLLF